MLAADIRSRFLAFFERAGHAVLPSAPLVPGDDPTLLFTNAGMVPFKKVFLGLEQPAAGRRATTAQKCVRAGGKHNDLEQVGHTARHHTFFEMLGNFSFGDYFKREAIRFAWEFVTADLKIDPRHIRVTVFHSDDEARALWREVAGLADERIFGLGEKDNFWQMADTGPCGPCSEIYVDLANLTSDWAPPEGVAAPWASAEVVDLAIDDFVEAAEAGRFLEIWNLVFMQFDRSADGTLTPLPKPSIDTGAGLERIAAALQGVTNNFHTDLFLPLIRRAEEIVGIPYEGQVPAAQRTRAEVDPASFHVLADHARAVAFLLADAVYPSNEGRGYVLRRILRRAVRHAWLLGRREPTLAPIVERVVEVMGDAYPDLRQRARYLVDTTRSEEERFLATIDGGMSRFDQLAPRHSTQGSSALRGTIAGEDAFRLYDTFGFPIDLTELMARERGYTVDISGFERALERQRAQSREERKGRALAVGEDELGDLTTWERASDGDVRDSFVGYDHFEVSTEVAAVRRLADDRVAVVLRETPFYAESGGQISDVGTIEGDGWRVTVDDVRKIDGRVAAIGTLSGELRFGPALARVPVERRRDTQRHHTATHLLHAALRGLLGDHVHQAGSLVAPDRLRFDFTHHGPLSPEQVDALEQWVNEAIWENRPLEIVQRSYAEAVAAGAMALFGEKYGDVVRVVTIPGLSAELCGGTHVRHTGEIGVFRIVTETGVAAGVRRIEAVTGRQAYERLRADADKLGRIGQMLRAPADGIERRLEALLDERRTLQRRLDEAMRGGGDQLQRLMAGAQDVDGVRLVAAAVDAADARELQALGDALREQMKLGVGVLAATFAEGKSSLLVVVTDDLRERGLRADVLVRDIASAAGGRGGGKPHMAQAGIPDTARIPEAITRAAGALRAAMSGVA
jgi:alanyl-tRNA synthetase